MAIAVAPSLLVDTHVLVWLRTSASKLAEIEREAILRALSRYVSVVSLWEIATLQNLGRLPADRRLLDVPRGFAMLPVLPEHCAAYAALPRLHKDPFDRMLIAQARIEKMTLLTRDQVVASYGREGCATVGAGLSPHAPP